MSKKNTIINSQIVKNELIFNTEQLNFRFPDWLLNKGILNKTASAGMCGFCFFCFPL